MLKKNWKTKTAKYEYKSKYKREEKTDTHWILYVHELMHALIQQFIQRKWKESFSIFVFSLCKYTFKSTEMKKLNFGRRANASASYALKLNLTTKRNLHNSGCHTQFQQDNKFKINKSIKTPQKLMFCVTQLKSPNVIQFTFIYLFFKCSLNCHVLIVPTVAQFLMCPKIKCLTKWFNDRMIFDQTYTHKHKKMCRW